MKMKVSISVALADVSRENLYYDGQGNPKLNLDLDIDTSKTVEVKVKQRFLKENQSKGKDYPDLGEGIIAKINNEELLDELIP